MDELRWILLVVGLLVVGGIYGYSRLQERKGGGRRRREAFGDDVDIDAALKGLDEVVAERDERGLPPEPVEVPDIRVEPRPAPPAARQPPRPAPRPAPAEPEEAPVTGEQKVIVLNVAATDGRQFGGVELAEALQAVNMRLGDHGIYHRTLDTRNGPMSLFSAANILKPGTLKDEELEQIHSPGVAMFLQLPGPYDGLAAFEQMLEAGRRIAEQLDVKLLDGRRCTLTNQAVEAIREELREYRRLAHLAAKKSV